MYMTALIRPWAVKKIDQIMFSDGINAKVFWRSIAFAIAIVVTSRSGAFEYTMSVHVFFFVMEYLPDKLLINDTLFLQFMVI